jgi:HIRAN domain
MFSRFYKTKLEWRRVAVYEPVSVAGLAFLNADGSDRQDILKTCHVGMRVVLRRDPANGDPHRVALFVNEGRQIGDLPAEAAERIAPLLDSGKSAFDAEIWSLERDERPECRERAVCRLLLTQHDLVPVKRLSWSAWFRGNGRSLPKIGVK